MLKQVDMATLTMLWCMSKGGGGEGGGEGGGHLRCNRIYSNDQGEQKLKHVDIPWWWWQNSRRLGQRCACMSTKYSHTQAPLPGSEVLQESCLQLEAYSLSP